MLLRKNYASSFTFILILLLSFPAGAAQVDLLRATSYTLNVIDGRLECQSYNLSIRGEILPGDELKFDVLAKELAILRFGKDACPGSILSLSSLGGNVAAAIKIAFAVRELKVTTSVDAYELCYSACFYIWAASVSRTVDISSRLGVHQSSIGGISTPEGTIAGAKLLRRWNINVDVTDAMLATPPNQLYTLTREDMGKVASWLFR